MDGDLRVKIAATGERASGRNEINARFQANEMRNLRGIDCGVLDDTLYDASTDFLGVERADAKEKPFTLAVSGNALTLGAGMATAYGYDLQIEDEVTLDASAIASGRTFYVCLEWDLSTSESHPYPTGDAVLHDNGTAKVWRGCKDGDNLIEVEEGVYDLPIYRLTKTSSGATIDGDWRDLRLCDEPRGVQVANTAVYAETKDADDGTDAAATTLYAEEAGRVMGDGMQTVANPILSSLASSVNSSLLSTSSATYTLAGTSATLTVHKLASGIVYGDMEWEAASSSDRLDRIPFDYSTVLCTLASAYRPAQEEICHLHCAANWEADSWVGSFCTYFCTIATDGTLTANNYKYHNNILYDNYTGVMSLHFAYTTSKASITAGQISDFTFYPVTATGTNVYIAAPSFCKRGRSFKVRAEAVHPFSEAVLSISGGTLDKTTGNGEFTVTPSSSTSSVTITATERYIDGATDENGNTSY